SLLFVFLFVFLVLFGGCQWFADNPMFPKAKMDVVAEILDESGATVTNGKVGIISVTNIESSSTDTSTSTQETASHTTTTNSSTTNSEVDTNQTIIGGTGGSGSTVANTTINATETQTVNTADTTNSSEQSDTSTTTNAVTFARDVKFTFKSLNNVGAEITKCQVIYKSLSGTSISSLTKVLDVHQNVIPSGSPIGAIYTQDNATVIVEIFDPVIENYFTTNKIRMAEADVTFFGTDFAGHDVFYYKTVYIQAY
ncbi:MAG: hypothetical protein NTX88_05915, partial [Candidatus Atribacteria bacterium]|nr:hypothetical protein [Candidatus Atribacteria bacterium]